MVGVMLPRLKNLRNLFLRVILSSACRAFFLSLTIWLLAFTYCKFRFWRDPHSAFFNSEHVYDFKYTTFRQEQAHNFLDELKKPDAAAFKASANPEICAAYVTVKRDGEQYIDAAIGSMLEGLTEWERSKLYLAVIFADPEPKIHPTFEQPWLEKAVDWTGGYNVSDEMHGHLKAWMENHEFAVKGVYDYLYALDFCLSQTNAPYVLIVEDDIITADSWLIKTKQAIRRIETKPLRGAKSDYNYLYMRLFYTETSLSWRETDFWYRRMDLLFVLSSSFTFLFLVGVRQKVPNSRQHLDAWTLCVLCLITVPAFITLLFMIGKYSLFPPTGVVVMNRYGCCSQALLYPREHVPGMVKWFREWSTALKKPYVNTDLMIDYYAEEQGLNKLALGPQVMQHVGIQSSRDNSNINGRSTRSFWFDEYDPVRLRREHDALVKSFGA